MRLKAFAMWAGLGSALILSLVVGTSGNAADDAPLAPALQDHRNPAVVRATGGERPIETPEQWAKRRAGILEGMQQVMGKLPDRATFPPLDVKLGEPAKADGYSRVPLTYDADGTGRVPAHLYLPEPREPGKRYPAIVALHQTSANGKDDLGGGAKNPNNSYVPELARRGYVVICPDYPSFGELKDYDFAKDPYESGTMKGVVNHMRAVDVLAGRDDVDADRIGAIGHSLGGHNAIFLGVFDERVKAVVTSCGWTPFHDYYKGNLKGWTQDRYMPRIRDVYESNPDQVPFDFPELVAAIAPRALFSVSPTRDANFEVEGVRRAEAAAKPVYELLGAADKLRVAYPDDEHNFAPEMRQAAYAFVDKVLGNEKPAAVAAKKDVPVEEQDFSGELPRIPAKEPAEAMKLLKTLPGFRVELAAAEPNVASPVAIAFDERGRMFVCEMRDYSEQDKERLGTIRMLEDADNDGTFEKATVFADDLSWPTALACYDGGLFVAAAPDIFWLKDTDGDGKADERKVVFTGFNRSNVQGLINSFHWGLDNRIHGATSTSGGKVRRPEDPESKAVNLSGRDFSFDPRTLELRPESGGAQHGMSFDDWGRKFVSANSDHIQMVMVDDRYLAANPHLTVPSARESIAADGPQARVFRISPVEPWRVVRTRLRASGAVKGIVEFGGQPAGYFTGATGVTIYRGDAFPEAFRGNAFCGDVGSNIVHRKTLEPNGVGLIAKRADENVEFLASTDIWFRPSQFANAPDGALYVIDTCREVIEHPASLPPMIKKHLDLTSGRDRGRIWRVVPDSFNRRPAQDLGKASTEELVKLLEHRNGWHRDTAARLLYQRQDEAAVPMLEKLAAASKMPEARVHAMYALAGLGALNADAVAAALADEDARVREHAIRLTELVPLQSAEQKARLAGLVSDPDVRVRYQLALTAGVTPDVDRLRLTAPLLGGAGEDRWMRAAAVALVGDKAEQLITKIAADEAGAAQLASTPLGRKNLSELARHVAARNQPAEVAAVIKAAGQRRELAGPLLAGLSAGSTGAGGSLRQRLANDAEATKTLDAVLDNARRVAGESGAPAGERVEAIGLLTIGSLAESRAVITKQITDNQPQDVQLAALAALDRFNDADVGAILTKAWPGMTPAVRAAAANVIFARPARAAAFLDAVEAGKIKAADVDRGRLKTLEAGDNAALRERAKKLLAAGSNKARQEVFESYRPALSLAGDAGRGKAVFEQSCAACHRVNDVGQEIGPNLAAMKARGAEAILLNVIDPNAEVNPLFVDYVVQTKSGRTTSGMLASETPGAVTLKRAGGETETINRSDVRRMRSSGLSIMPEGLEQGISHQQMADVIAYILSAN